MIIDKSCPPSFPEWIILRFQNTWRLVLSTKTSLQFTDSDMLFKGKEFSLKCILTSIHEKGISFGLLKIFLIVSTWAIEQIAVSEGLTVATLAPRRICDYSRVNMRSASIFLSLWKLHSGGQGETVAVAVRENVWEPLKLGLISGYSRVVYLVCW